MADGAPGRELTGGTGADLWGLTRGSTPAESTVALWNWAGLASGATGILYWQYRPEGLGPEGPGFGLVRRDGELTDRAETAGRFADLVSDHPEIEAAEPPRGDLAIGLLPDAPLFNYVAEQDIAQFNTTARGAYRAFWDGNYLVDFAKPHQFESYDAVYLPFPLLLTGDQADAVAAYVENGGTLVADGAPAAYDETGRVVSEAPGYGLDEVFGVHLAETRYAGDERLEVGGGEIPAAERRDVFEPRDASVLGTWSDGSVGAVRNEYGDGTAAALGTLAGRASAGDDGAGDALRGVLADLGVSPRVSVDRPDVRACLHEHDDGAILYVMNLGDAPLRTAVTAELGAVESVLGDASHVTSADDETIVELPARSGGALVTSDD